MAWFRIDNRLVHGQIIEAWLPYLDAVALIVVNDRVAGDFLQQQIMRLAIPERISVTFVPVSGAKAVFEQLEAIGASSLFLFANCEDISRLVRMGVQVTKVNIGNMHFSEGKRQLCPHVAVSPSDLQCFDFLKKNGTQFDFRCVPSDDPHVEEW